MERRHKHNEPPCGKMSVRPIAADYQFDISTIRLIWACPQWNPPILAPCFRKNAFAGCIAYTYLCCGRPTCVLVYKEYCFTRVRSICDSKVVKEYFYYKATTAHHDIAMTTYCFIKFDCCGDARMSLIAHNASALPISIDCVV
jgi:hypothetical protein